MAGWSSSGTFRVHDATRAAVRFSNLPILCGSRVRLRAVWFLTTKRRSAASEAALLGRTGRRMSSGTWSLHLTRRPSSRSLTARLRSFDSESSDRGLSRTRARPKLQSDRQVMPPSSPNGGGVGMRRSQSSSRGLLDRLDDFNEFQNFADPLVGDTDGDRILDKGESLGNVTQIEGSDPTIPVARATFVIEYDAHGLPTGKVTITVHLEARDNVGVEYIEVSPGVTVGDAFRPIGDSQKVFCAAASGAVCTALIADVEFGGDYWALVQGAAAGWDGQASVGDVNGNGGIGTLHADSILQAVARAILGAILALVDAVTKLAASALEWLWESITALFDPLMQVIGEFLQGILQRLVEAVGSATHALPLGLIEQAAPFFEVLERLVIVLGIIRVAILLIPPLFEP